MPEPVWRRLAVPAAASLADLSSALLVAFGWHASHLSAFWTGEPWRGTCYRSRMELDHFGGEGSPSDGVAVGTVLHGAGDELCWIYDYGDEWRHWITAEPLADDPTDRFRCIDGANAAPPEDCGGEPGYRNLLEAIADPAHPEHDELVEWLGGPFDPSSFSVETIDHALAQVPVLGVTPA